MFEQFCVPLIVAIPLICNAVKSVEFYLFCLKKKKTNKAAIELIEFKCWCPGVTVDSVVM